MQLPLRACTPPGGNMKQGHCSKAELDPSLEMRLRVRDWLARVWAWAQVAFITVPL